MFGLLFLCWYRDIFSYSSAVFANTNRNTALSFRYSCTHYHVSGQYILGSSVHISTELICYLLCALPGENLYRRTSARMEYCARIGCLHHSWRLFLPRVLWQNTAGFNSVIRLPVIYFLDFHLNAVMTNLGSDFKQLGHEVETERDFEIVHHVS